MTPQGRLSCPSPDPSGAEAGQEHPVGSEPLHAIVLVIDHVQVVAGIEGQARGPIDLAGSRACLSPPLLEIAFRVEYRDQVGVLVADEYAAPAVLGDGGRPGHLALCLSEASEGAEVFALQVGDGDADAPIVSVQGPADDVEPPVGADHGVVGIVEAAPLHRRKSDGVAVLQEGAACLRLPGLHREPPAQLSPVRGRVDC